MSLAVQLIISLVIAIIAATLTTALHTGGLFEPTILIAFCIATVATALIVRGKGAPAPSAAKPVRERPAVAASDANRETGKVKWFNISKGFGFIVRDDGEEIFVHFRSIRGEGRRGLRDGQAVSFIVTDSDKGPQAEDVVGEE